MTNFKLAGSWNRGSMPGFVSAAVLFAILGSGRLLAATDYGMSADDGSGTSSFNSQGNWNPAGGGAPSAGNNYFVNNYTMRTPTGLQTISFQGATLQLANFPSPPPNAGPTGPSRLTLKSNSGSTITVSDLRASGGSRIDQGTGGTSGSQSIQTVDGNLKVTGTVRLDAANLYRTLVISSAVSNGTASGSVSIESSEGAGGIVKFTNTANTYSGDTQIANNTITGGTNAVTLQMGATNALPNDTSSGDLIVNTNGALSLSGFGTTVQGLVDGKDSGGTIQNAMTGLSASNAALTIQGHLGADKTFSGKITDGGTGGTLSIVKSGAGVQASATRQILSGTNNDYTGTTTVRDGQLRFVGAGSLGTGAVTVTTATTGNAWGTLELSSVGSKSNAITLDGRSDATAHIVGGAGTNTLSGGVTLAAGEKFNLSSGTVTGTTLNITGPITTTALATGTHEFNLSGAGTGTIAQAITLYNTATNTLNKTDGGTWTLSGAVTNLNALNASAGTLALGSGISVAGDMAVGGTLQLGGANASANGLTGAGILSGNGANTLNLALGAIGATTKTFSGTIANGTGGVVSLTKTGDNTQILSGSGTNTYTGVTTISGGTLQIQKDSALGAATPTTTANTVINGTGTLALSNLVAGPGITSAEAITLAGRAGTGAHINNVISDNTLTGTITLDSPVSGPNNFNIVSSAGTLTIQGGISGGAAGNARNLNLSGNGIVTIGAISMGGSGSGGVATINKDGSGTWTLNSSVTGVNEIKANAGTLAIGNAAGVSTVDKFFVASGAIIDATAVASNFDIGLAQKQTLYGAGTVQGPSNGVVAQSGATIDVGNGAHTDIATLSITGNMTLAAGSLIQINLDPTGGAAVDLLAVSNILTVADHAKLAFYMGSPLTAHVYEFASYATLTSGHGTFDVTTTMPTGYHIDYAYQDHYIALVSDIPVPVPAPLFLIGLGGLIMGASRRYAKW